MKRAEVGGFGLSLAGHGLLVAILSLGFFSATQPPITSQPIEVSFVDDVALVSASPDPVPVPAQSVAPEVGAPEEAAPIPEPVTAPPEPAPPQPRPRPAPPEPAPSPRPSQKAAPAKPAAPKAAPKSAPKAAPKAAPKERTKAGSGEAERTRGSRLGENFLKGIGRDPTPERRQSPPGATMSSQAAANIASVIARQVQPCADRQVNPGPGANRISTRLNLRLDRDGSLASRPRVMGQSGVDDENRRYAERVADLAIATFTGCAPLKGLPEELYAVPNGWRNFTMNYRLPG